MIQIACNNIPDPLPIWAAYARQYPGTLRDYDLADPGQPDVLTAEDAWRTRKIGSRITRSECGELERRARDAPWGAVPADADLADADPDRADGLFSAAAALYWH